VPPVIRAAPLGNVKVIAILCPLSCAFVSRRASNIAGRNLVLLSELGAANAILGSNAHTRMIVGLAAPLFRID